MSRLPEKEFQIACWPLVSSRVPPAARPREVWDKGSW